MSEIKTTATFDDKASPGVKKLKAEIDKLSQNGKGIRTGLDDRATPAIRKIRAELDKIKDTKATVGIDDKSSGGLNRLRSALQGLTGLSTQLGQATQSLNDAFSEVTAQVGSGSNGMLGGLLGIFAAYKGAIGISEAASAANAKMADSLKKLADAEKNLGEARAQSAKMSADYKAAKLASGIERAPRGSILAQQRAMDREAPKALFRASNAEFKAARAEFAAINAEVDALATGRALTVIGSTLGAIGAAAAVAAAAMETMAFSARATADANAEMADKLGITTKQLADLTVVANENGTTVEGLQGTFDKLSRSMNKFDDDNKKAKYAFESLGLSMEDVANLSEQEVAGKIIANYELLGRSTKATAAVQQLLGSSFREQIPAIKAMADGVADADARVSKFGAESTQDLIDAGGKQERALTDLGLAWQGLSNEIARNAGTIIQDTATFFADLLNGFRSSMAQMRQWQEQAKGIKEAIPEARRAEIAAEARRAQEEGRIGPKRSDLINYRLELYAKEMEAIQGVSRAEVEAENQRLLNRSKAAQSDPVRQRSAAAKPPTKDVKELKSELEGLVDQLNLANRAFGLDDVTKQGLEAKKKYIEDIRKGIDPTVAKNLLDQANAEIALAQALKKAADEQKAYEDATKSLEDYQAETAMMAYEASLVGKTADERERLMQTYREEVQLRATIAGLGDTDVEAMSAKIKAAQVARAEVQKALGDAAIVNEIMGQSNEVITQDVQRRILAATKLLEDGKITVDDYLKYVEDQMGRFKDNTKDDLTEVQTFWAEAAKGIQGDFQTFFFDVMQGNTTNFAKSMKKTIDGVIANILAAKAATALFGSSFDKGNVGGLVGSGASWLGSLFSGARASGGPVSAGSMYLVGEKGPEPFIPSTSGTVLPNSSLKNLASNQSFNIQVTAIDSKDLIAKMSTIEREMARMVNNANATYRVGAR